MTVFWTKYIKIVLKICNFFSTFGWNGSGSGKMIPIRPDPDPNTAVFNAGSGSALKKEKNLIGLGIKKEKTG